MAGRECIGKIISWEKLPGVPGVGWLKCRISDCEKREYEFNAGTKETAYTHPIRGDRVSFRVVHGRDGDYISDVKFIMTGN